MSTHADLVEHRKTTIGSERSFGLVFAAVFAIIALFPLWRGAPPRWWALAVALGFAALAYAAPQVLRPLNRLWFRLGLLLHHIVNPVIMALLYFVAIVPMGLFLKLRGKDLLRLERDAKAETYWIAREPQSPAPGSMSKQF